jgi:predicted AlkP superfamily phosphohydrolase/phosphomutase
LEGLLGEVSMDIRDFAPTVLEHFGVAVPGDVQGRSLLPGGYAPRV